MDNVKNSLNQPIATWNCGGRLIIVDKPMIMGIINVTPDSFFDGNAEKTTHDFNLIHIYCHHHAQILN
jgi:dihydropteroate synthase